MKTTQTIFGIHAVKHCLEQSPEQILEIWIQESRKNDKAMKYIIRLINSIGISIQYTQKKTIDNLIKHANHQGVLLKRKIIEKNNSFSELLRSVDSSTLFLVLDGIQDPQNLGACIRTADAAGVSAVIIPKNKSVQVNATVQKVASGATENISVISVTNLSRSLRDMQEAGVWIIGTDDEATETIFDVDFNIATAIVLGSEGAGLRHNTCNQCDKLVSIPMHGIVESLNVSVAAGICLYEVVRQRRNQ